MSCGNSTLYAPLDRTTFFLRQRLTDVTRTRTRNNNRQTRSSFRSILELEGVICQLGWIRHRHHNFILLRVWYPRNLHGGGFNFEIKVKSWWWNENHRILTLKIIAVAAPVSDIDQFAQIADETTKETRYIETTDKGNRCDARQANDASLIFIAVLVEGMLTTMRGLLTEHESDSWMYAPSPFRWHYGSYHCQMRNSLSLPQLWLLLVCG